MSSAVRERLSDQWSPGNIHTFVNPFSYSVLRKKTALIDSFDRVLVDGQLLVVFLKALGVAKLKRKSFDMTSLASEVFSYAVADNRSVFFVGTTPKSISAAADEILNRFPGLKLVGYHHGYLDDEEDASNVIDVINTKTPDIVVVGMGTPRQEHFLVKLGNSNWSGTGFTCGGFFHQSATGIDYYPRWADKLHLRWLYRIFDEPKLAKRYFLQYPVALWLVFWDFKIKPIFSDR